MLLSKIVTKQRRKLFWRFAISKINEILKAFRESNIMEDALKLLKDRVIGAGQCVTKTTLLRQTSLKAHQIDR
jgi:hypothetical protein